MGHFGNSAMIAPGTIQPPTSIERQKNLRAFRFSQHRSAFIDVPPAWCSFFISTTNERAHSGQYSAHRSAVMTDLLCMGIDIRERLLHAALSLGYDRTAHHLSR
jgi:hypothetical protein